MPLDRRFKCIAAAQVIHFHWLTTTLNEQKRVGKKAETNRQNKDWGDICEHKNWVNTTFYELVAVKGTNEFIRLNRTARAQVLYFIYMCV